MIMSTVQKPVLFLAFANDRDDRVDDRYLRDLPRETRRVRAALETAERAGLCDLVVRTNVTVQEIFDVFRDPRYRDRVAGFHFGGHADGYALLFETLEGELLPVDSEDLARFLGQQRGLEFIFLNACSTQPQTDDLLDAGVSVVIATAQDIDDDVAAEFSAQFYASLGSGASIRTAYNEATAVLQSQHPDELEQLYREAAAYSDEHAADRWPWNIYTREGAEISADWNLPDAAGDPLFGLPPPPPMDLPVSPYRHLHWFRREHAPVFFGRGHEIRTLYQRVTASDAAPLILYYGQSGVGKSSLLAAGLLPRLERDYQVRYVRRDRAKGLAASLAGGLNAAVDADPCAAWRGLENDAGKPLVVVLDQVEEVFTHPGEDPDAEIEAGLAMLQSLFLDPDQRPQGKLILAFRKEWLAELEHRFAEMKLSRAKVYLPPLTRRGIVEAVEGPASTERLRRQYNLTIADGLADAIADDLRSDRESPIAPVLQILLTRMWETASARAEDNPTFDSDLYWQMKRDGILLDDFLDRQLTVVKKWRAEPVDSGLVLDLLACHTTPLGTAAQVNARELAERYAHRADLPHIVQKNKDLYLLVDVANGSIDDKNANGPETHSTRLAHDTLAPLVRKRYEESDAPGQHARRILENRAPTWRRPDGQVETLDDVDLAAVERGRNGMRTWTDEERALVEASQAARAERRRRRRFWQAAGVAAIALIIVAAIVAFTNWKTAAAERDRAWRNDSLRLANLALQTLPDDPVAGVQLASIALGANGTKRPYVARAEYALAQAVRAVQEEKYLETGIRSPRQIASGPDWIAVGGDQLLLVRPDLSESIALPGDYGEIQGVGWSDDGRLLAYDASALYLWDSQELTAARGFDAGSIGCAAWRPGGGEIAVCAGQSLLIWDPAGDGVRTVIEDIDAGAPVPASTHAVAWSPDGRWLAFRGMNLGIWDVRRGEMVRLTRPDDPDPRPISFAVWSPDSRWLASSWGEQLARLWPAGHEAEPAGGGTGVAEGARFLPTDDGGYNLLVWGDDGYLATWRLEGRESDPHWTSQLFAGAGESRQGETFTGVALDEERGRMAVYSDAGSVYVGHPRQPALAIELVGRHEGAAILDAAWRGDYLATASVDGQARVWDVAARRPLTVLTGRLGRVLGVRWIDDARLLTFDQTAPGEDVPGSLRVWRIFDGAGRPLCTRASPDLAARCRTFGRPVPALAQLSSGYERIRWLADGSLLATDHSAAVVKGPADAENSGAATLFLEGVDEDALVVWNPTGDALLRYVPQYSPAPEEGVAVGELWRSGMGGWHRAGEIPGPISGANWLPAGLLIGRPDNRVALVDPETGATLLADEAGRVQAAALDEGRVALIAADKTIHIWDVTDQQPPITWRPGEAGVPLTLAAIPGERSLLAVYYEDGRFILAKWKEGNETWRWTFPDVGLEMGDIRCSPDGRYAGVVMDGRAYVVDVTASDRYWTSPESGYITGLAWHPAGREFSTWGTDKEARIWQWEPEKMEATLVDRAPHETVGVEPQFGPDGRTLLTIDGGVPTVWRLWGDVGELLDATGDMRSVRALSPAQREQFGVALEPDVN